MAILTGSAARQYIARGGQYKQLSLPSPQQQQIPQPQHGGLFGGIEEAVGKIPLVGGLVKGIISPATGTLGNLTDLGGYAVRSLLDPQGTSALDYRAQYNPEMLQAALSTFDQPRSDGAFGAWRDLFTTQMQATAPALQMAAMTMPITPVSSIGGKAVNPLIGKMMGAFPAGSLADMLNVAGRGEVLNPQEMVKAAARGGLFAAGTAGVLHGAGKLAKKFRKPTVGQMQIGAAAGDPIRTLKLQMERALNSKDARLAKGIFQKLPAQEQTSMYKTLIEKTAGESFDDIIAKKVTEEVQRGGIGRLGARLEEAGTRKIKGGLGIKTPKTPQGFQQSQQLTDDLISLTSSRGFSPTPKGIGQTFEAVSKELDDALVSSRSRINMGSVLDDWTTRLDDIGVAPTTPAERRLQDSLLDKLTKIGDDGSPQAVAKLKQDVAKTLRRLKVFDRIEKGEGLKPNEQMLYDFWGATDNALKTQVPEARAFYDQMHTLYEVAPDIIKKADRSGHIGSPLLLKGVSVPTGGIPQKISLGAGRGLQKIGRVLQGKGLQGIGRSRIGTGLQNILGTKTMGQLGRLGQQLAPTQAARMFAGGDRLMTPQAQAYQGQFAAPDMGMGFPGAQFAGGMPSQDVSGLRQLMIRGVMSGEIDPSRAKFIMGYLGEGGDVEPRKMTKDMANARAGIRALDEVEALMSQGHSVWKAQLPGPFRDSNLANAIDHARDVISRLRSGAALNEREEELYKSMLPTIWDDQAEAAAKMRRLREMFSSVASGLVQEEQQQEMNPYETALGL